MAAIISPDQLIDSSEEYFFVLTDENGNPIVDSSNIPETKSILAAIFNVDPRVALLLGDEYGVYRFNKKHSQVNVASGFRLQRYEPTAEKPTPKDNSLWFRFNGILPITKLDIFRDNIQYRVPLHDGNYQLYLPSYELRLQSKLPEKAPENGVYIDENTGHYVIYEEGIKLGEGDLPAIPYELELRTPLSEDKSLKENTAYLNQTTGEYIISTITGTRYKGTLSTKFSLDQMTEILGRKKAVLDNKEDIRNYIVDPDHTSYTDGIYIDERSGNYLVYEQGNLLARGNDLPIVEYTLALASPLPKNNDGLQQNFAYIDKKTGEYILPKKNSKQPHRGILPTELSMEQAKKILNCRKAVLDDSEKLLEYLLANGHITRKGALVQGDVYSFVENRLERGKSDKKDVRETIVFPSTVWTAPKAEGDRTGVPPSNIPISYGNTPGKTYGEIILTNIPAEQTKGIKELTPFITIQSTDDGKILGIQLYSPPGEHPIYVISAEEIDAAIYHGKPNEYFAALLGKHLSTRVYTPDFTPAEWRKGVKQYRLKANASEESPPEVTFSTVISTQNPYIFEAHATAVKEFAPSQKAGEAAYEYKLTSVLVCCREINRIIPIDLASAKSLQEAILFAALALASEIKEAEEQKLIIKFGIIIKLLRPLTGTTYLDYCEKAGNQAQKSAATKAYQDFMPSLHSLSNEPLLDDNRIVRLCAINNLRKVLEWLIELSVTTGSTFAPLIEKEVLNPLETKQKEQINALLGSSRIDFANVNQLKAHLENLGVIINSMLPKDETVGETVYPSSESSAYFKNHLLKEMAAPYTDYGVINPNLLTALRNFLAIADLEPAIKNFLTPVLNDLEEQYQVNVRVLKLQEGSNDLFPFIELIRNLYGVEKEAQLNKNVAFNAFTANATPTPYGLYGIIKLDLILCLRKFKKETDDANITLAVSTALNQLITERQQNIIAVFKNDQGKIEIPEEYKKWRDETLKSCQELLPTLLTLNKKMVKSASGFSRTSGILPRIYASEGKKLTGIEKDSFTNKINSLDMWLNEENLLMVINDDTDKQKSFREQLQWILNTIRFYSQAKQPSEVDSGVLSGPVYPDQNFQAEIEKKCLAIERMLKQMPRSEPYSVSRRSSIAPSSRNSMFISRRPSTIQSDRISPTSSSSSSSSSGAMPSSSSSSSSTMPSSSSSSSSTIPSSFSSSISTMPSSSSSSSSAMPSSSSPSSSAMPSSSSPSSSAMPSSSSPSSSLPLSPLSFLPPPNAAPSLILPPPPPSAAPSLIPPPPSAAPSLASPPPPSAPPSLAPPPPPSAPPSLAPSGSQNHSALFQSIKGDVSLKARLLDCKLSLISLNADQTIQNVIADLDSWEDSKDQITMMLKNPILVKHHDGSFGLYENKEEKPLAHLTGEEKEQLAKLKFTDQMTQISQAPRQIVEIIAAYKIPEKGKQKSNSPSPDGQPPNLQAVLGAAFAQKFGKN